MLATLAERPADIIETLQQIFNDKKVVPLMAGIDFAYNEVLKHTSLKERIELLTYKQIKSLYLLNRVVKEKVVLIFDEIEIEEMIEMNPALPLHKGRNSQFLYFCSPLLTRRLGVDLRREIKRM